MTSLSESKKEPAINPYFKHKALTNVTIVSSDQVHFFVDDHHLKAASLTFRDILSLPGNQDVEDKRPLIGVEEEGILMQDLLLLMTRAEADVAPLLKKPKAYTNLNQLLAASVNHAIHLNQLLSAASKYQMYSNLAPIKKAIQAEWNPTKPLKALEQAAPWRDAGAIAYILSFHSQWNIGSQVEMVPWNLSRAVVEDMGAVLFQSYAKAFCGSMESVSIGQVFWNGAETHHGSRENAEFARQLQGGMDWGACATALLREAEP